MPYIRCDGTTQATYTARISVTHSHTQNSFWFISLCHTQSYNKFASSTWSLVSRTRMCLQCFDTVGWAAGRASECM